MSAYRLATASTADGSCGTIGGKPSLPVDTEWPVCRMCQEPLVALLDLVLPKLKTSPFQAGSRLQVFACRQHDDIAGTIYSDYSKFDNASQEKKLPRSYWDLNDGHYLLRLLPPSEAVKAAKAEPRLTPQHLQVAAWADKPDEDIKLFGDPDWIQDPQEHICACGKPMQMLLQIPDGFAFPIKKGAAEQPGTFSATKYLLFLGNQLFLFGCTGQCNPLALWPVLQN